MTIELARVEIKQKPWGSIDLLPWNGTSMDGKPVGELWFQRADRTAPATALLLKLLFTTEPLSIQVHPDDVFARSIGLANGKSEAWYILSAGPDAQIALGLKHMLSSSQLRSAIADGSVVDMVRWHPARAGDVVFVPAGTIHAIGGGIVLAEVQQQSDATFRLFDYGRPRALHIDNAVAAAVAGPAKRQSSPMHLDEARKAVVIDAHFVLEQLECQPGSLWTIDVPKEAWLLAIGGSARIGSIEVTPGEAIFAAGDRADIEVGDQGLKALLAYLGPDVNLGALQQRRDTNGQHSSLAPSIAAAAVPEHFLPKTPEAQT
jgi:mannose-6-phosphate isomerase